MTSAVVTAFFLGLNEKGEPLLKVSAVPRFEFCERVARSLDNSN